jgi:uncharacterized protein (DUF1800 family)
MPHLSNQRKNQHLLWRAAFGPMVENADQLNKISPFELYKELEKDSEKVPDDFFITGNPFDGLAKGLGQISEFQKLDKDQKKMLRKESVDALKSLNLTWLDSMINSDAQLREKASLFWHGHFACRVINSYFQQQLINIVRANALGNFGDLLRQVSKSPAMLAFLNNQENKKQHPNENFAREVMELFTMGRGNYSEEDVKESARAFTGWGFNFQGEFVERSFLHDYGTKTFLGKTGNFDGDDILDIILEQRQTAYFITQKIYRYFVNEYPDPDHIEKLADRFYQSGYDIRSLLSAIFTSAWFYDDKNIGTHIKSPVELLVGIRRMIPMEPQRPEIQLLFQRALGQVLFYPPNVAGWPGGRNWIDSSTLLLRMRIPQILALSGEFSVRPKEDDDMTMGREGIDENQRPRRIDVTVDWQQVTKVFRDTPPENLEEAVNNLLYQTKSRISHNILNHYADEQSKGDFIKSVMIDLMSTPEYQLC